jgi:hypothetical protein
MKSRLKAPEIKRLRLKHDNLLSRFASNFNLRRYTMMAEDFKARAYTRPLFSST